MEKTAYELWLYDNFGTNLDLILHLFSVWHTPANIFTYYNECLSECFKERPQNMDLKKYLQIAYKMKEQEIETVTILEEAYPALLKNVEDAPYLLFYKGELPKEAQRMVSVVGPRKASEYGKWASYKIAQLLCSHHVIVVSGLAYGADTCAHKACIDEHQKTIAVLGTGVDLCSPLSNQRLSEKIIEGGGALLSEFFPGTPGFSRNYPRRNRIISGISESLVVVEAGERSGTLLTVGHALNQGKDVYALPGNITSIYSKGTNKLIKDGAIPILDFKDLINEMKLSQTKNTLLDEFTPQEKQIYKYIALKGMVTKDELRKATGKTMGELNFILTVLELKNAVETVNGKIAIAK